MLSFYRSYLIKNLNPFKPGTHSDKLVLLIFCFMRLVPRFAEGLVTEFDDNISHIDLVSEVK